MGRILKDEKNKVFIAVDVKGKALLSNSLLNKGMAFSDEERETFELQGLLPLAHNTLEEQSERSYQAFRGKHSDLEKHIYLRDLQDSNETLFYALILKHLQEMLPIVYTPTVGEACMYFSHIYRRPRGLYVSYPMRDHLETIFASQSFDGIEAIVVSDGERILGLGDQGAGGMGIPIGKLSLYTACGGIDPATTLPILLDVGTDNEERLNDPLYIGWKNKRIRDKDYNDFVETFVQVVKKRFPKVLLQWEDFAQKNATPILAKYRDQLCTFNDDIQGTAAVAAGALFAAMKVTKIPLKEQRIVIVGAGSAGCGIAELMVQAMVDEGLTESEALSRFYLINRSGLLLEDTLNLLPFQKKFVQKKSAVAEWKLGAASNISLQTIVANLHPTLLLGVSGQPDIFTEEIIKDMAAHVKRPVIFPLSNPTVRSEATPENLLNWTEGRAIVSTGSPFAPVNYQGKTRRIDQTNNAYIFPGVALGILAVKATRVSDKMFMKAAKALATCSPAITGSGENLLPPVDKLREVSFTVALAVAKEAQASGLAQPCSEKELIEKIKDKMWDPQYLPYRKK